MRFVQVVEKLKMRFTQRDESFVEGVEVGMLMALMGMELPRIRRTIGTDSVEQARAVADKLGYGLVIEDQHDGMVEIALTKRGLRPALRLVR